MRLPGALIRMLFLGSHFRGKDLLRARGLLGGGDSSDQEF